LYFKVLWQFPSVSFAALTTALSPAPLEGSKKGLTLKNYEK